jgi:glycosyltransferase involved in cell wall biosynthesis
LTTDRKTKVCIISNARSAHVQRWAGILSLKGYDTYIISSEQGAANIKGTAVFECISRNYRFYLAKSFHELFRAIRIRRIIADIKPDIVHIHSFDYIHPFMIALVNYVSNGFPNLVVSTWGTDVLGNPYTSVSWRGSLAKRILLKQAREITATTQFLAEATSRLAPVGRKIHVIPFGIDCNMFCRKGNRSNDRAVHIGFIKHLAPKYGPDYLLKALAVIIKDFPDVNLTMAGQGSMDNYLKQLAADLGIEKHVRFPGHIEYEKIPEMLSGMDIFAMPSISETFGVAAVEAQAMEVPVVASNIGGVPEAVIDGETGILVEPGNVKELANAIMRLIRNPEERMRMGKAGRKFVLQNYNIEDNFALLEKLYNKMMCSK